MNQQKNNPARPERLYGTSLNGAYSVSGTVHVIRDESELPYFREGEILVASCIDSKWVKQLSEAKALIEDADAKGSQVSQLSSHFNIPAVVAVKEAVASLRSGDIVTIHSSGEIELRVELRAPDSPMRVSVPAAVDSRSHNGIITAPNVETFSGYAEVRLGGELNNSSADNSQTDGSTDDLASDNNTENGE